MNSKKPTPIILPGLVVRLEPLSLDHVADLAEVSYDDRIWQYMASGFFRTREEIERFIRLRLRQQKEGNWLPFAVIEMETGKAIGSTSYLEIRPFHGALEIGGTWYGVDYWRTGVNTETKYLLLRHAFEELGYNRVQFKTDERNVRSQKAIMRIGGVEEGILRQHLVMADGHIRDTAYYSILASEWGAVQKELLAKMGQR